LRRGSDLGAPAPDLAEKLIKHILAPILDDLSGSAEYRLFILKKTLKISSTNSGGTEREL
jgi:hypothetical protein